MHLYLSITLQKYIISYTIYFDTTPMHYTNYEERQTEEQLLDAPSVDAACIYNEFYVYN